MQPNKEDLLRLSDLPTQIRELDRKINGMKRDKERVEQKLAAREARHLRAVVDAKEYTNDKARAAVVTILCDEDPEWQKDHNRLLELKGTIDATVAQREYLRREKDVLFGRLLGHSTAQLAALIEDKRMAEMIGRGLLS